MTPWSLKQALQISKIKKSDNYVQLGLLEISNVRCITTHNWSLILIIEGIQIFCGLFEMLIVFKGLPRCYRGQESTYQSRRCRFHPWVGKMEKIHDFSYSPGVGNGNPLQYPCLENPMDRGAWWAIVHGVAKELDMTELELERLCSEKIHRDECYGI